MHGSGVKGTPRRGVLGRDGAERGAFHSWQTVDPSFMTATRSQLTTLRLLVEHCHVSLYTLNAPQEAMRVTPLGFAAWVKRGDVR